MLEPVISSIKTLYVAGVYTVFVASFALMSGCFDRVEDDQKIDGVNIRTAYVDELPTYPSKTLPDGLVWETNDDDPVYASSDAKKGGMFRSAMLTFPLTLRVVGPDSNTGLRSLLLGNQFALTDIHPNTHKIMPALATHWAYDDDGKTVYYKLDPDVRWSDGRPVLADDYLFTLDFMRSEFIVAPWYNKHYTEQILEITKYDDYTISITGAIAKPKIDLHYYYGIIPTARHFHQLDENWVSNYNWRIEPNTGPYQITKIKKGKYIEFSLKENWWAKDRKYYKNRFNVKKFRLDVIRDLEAAYRHFLKGEIDAFGLTMPSFWHDKAKGDLFDNGYIHKIWFYNDMPRPSEGMYLNQKSEWLQDENIRYGLAHSMNVELMINTVLRGDYSRLHNLDTGYGDYSNTEIKAREFDLQKADAYFNKAGWVERDKDGIRIKNNRRLSFVVTYGSELHANRLVLLKEEAKKAGVELVLEQLDPAAMYKKEMEKQHEIAWMAWGFGFHPQYWGQFHSDNADIPQTNNITNTKDKILDALIERFRNSADGKERAALAREIQQYIHDLGVVIPLTTVSYVRSAYWRWVKLPNPPGTKWSDTLFDPTNGDGMMGSTGGLFWIDEEEKEKTLAAMKKGEVFEPVTIIDTTYKIQ
jgi:microcin C transport system substrate-binding protein